METVERGKARSVLLLLIADVTVKSHSDHLHGAVCPDAGSGMLLLPSPVSSSLCMFRGRDSSCMLHRTIESPDVLLSSVYDI